MSTIRVAKNRNYSVINNTVLNDKRLTWKAKGLAAYLLSKPDDWHIVREHLEEQAADGITAVRTGLQELERCGYLVRTRRQAADGRFEWEQTLYETPIEPPCNSDDRPSTDYPSVDFPPMDNLTVDNPPVENPTVENLTLLSTEVVTTDQPITEVIGTEREKGKSKRAAPAPAPSDPTAQQVLFGKVCEIIGWDTKALSDKDRAQVAQTAGILDRAGYSVADLDQFWDTVWKMDWRWTNKHSRPSLTQLRQEIGKLRSKIEPTPTDQTNGYTNGRPTPMSKVDASLAAVDRVMARLDAEGADQDEQE